MARLVKRVLSAIAALVVAFGATTWWALESRGVAVIETHTPEGELRSTHVWYAESQGELWLEAGTPANPWFQDVQRNPAITFRVDGRVSRYTARTVEGSAAHSRIRSLLRARYGFRDVWVGLITDTSRSVAVRLIPEEG